MKLVLSAGHQLELPGAYGQGVREEEANIRMCDRIVTYFNGWGVDYDYMPNNVGNLDAECAWVNARYKDGDAYAVQVHRNAGGGTGNEVWTTAYKNQIPLATSILKAMTEFTGLKSRGVRDIKNYSPLGWITHINCESVLIEARFIDVDSVKPADEMLDAYAIAVGIARFLGVKYGKSLEEEATDAAIYAAKLAAEKAEADRLANLARIEAEKQAEIARIAELKRLQALEEAKRTEAERIAAEKAAADAVAQIEQKETTNFILWLKNLFELIARFLTSWKGK